MGKPRKSLAWLAASLLLSSIAPAHAEPGQVDNIKEAFVRLYACWKPPPASQANPDVDITAIVTFTRTLAVEAKRDRIRVNAVTPSLIEGTETGDRALAGGFSKKLFEKARQQAHLGPTEPDDLADLIVFLAGPGSARITGQVISVNGGISVA